MAARTIIVSILLALPVAGHADERILSFASRIEVAADGGMRVTETLRVRAEGNAIRRGIFRDFPTDYRDRLGNHYRVGFEVLTARRDGAPEMHREERRANGVRVYLGRSDYFLPAGEHEYELVYHTDHQLGFFADHDELYWNVTGNDWAFPIDAAEAAVALPAAGGFALTSVEGYTGVTGSRGQDYTAHIDDPSHASIRTTRTLSPGEGLTVVVTWPKGWIAEPSRLERLRFLLVQNLGLELALVAFVLTWGYFVYVWYRVGRDPEPGVIFPHYTPPAHWSPASVRYLTRMGYDNKAFTAAIINLAVEGRLRIEEVAGDYTLTRIAAASGTDERSGLRSAGNRLAPGKRLAPGEEALLTALFAEDETIELDNKNHRVLQRAMRAHRKSLSRHYNRVYFVTNSLLLAPGVLLVLAGFAMIFALGLMSPAVIIVLVATVLSVPVFAYLLKAPTRVGRRALDEIEGFKQYLEVAEKDELELRNPPEKTPELFEAFLPYALALGVEQHWAEKFASVFARLAEQPSGAYQPSWYRGHWDAGRIASHIGRFTNDMTGSLSSAIAAASTPPGSSSGSGGGGSSGGGGGGGGGGGW